eukprot:tig00001284_g8015.t1
MFGTGPIQPVGRGGGAAAPPLHQTAPAVTTEIVRAALDVEEAELLSSLEPAPGAGADPNAAPAPQRAPRPQSEGPSKRPRTEPPRPDGPAPGPSAPPAPPPRATPALPARRAAPGKGSGPQQTPAPGPAAPAPAPKESEELEAERELRGLREAELAVERQRVAELRREAAAREARLELLAGRAGEAEALRARLEDALRALGDLQQRLTAAEAAGEAQGDPRAAASSAGATGRVAVEPGPAGERDRGVTECGGGGGGGGRAARGGSGGERERAAVAGWDQLQGILAASARRDRELIAALEQELAWTRERVEALTAAVDEARALSTKYLLRSAEAERGKAEAGRAAEAAVEDAAQQRIQLISTNVQYQQVLKRMSEMSNQMACSERFDEEYLKKRSSGELREMRGRLKQLRRRLKELLRAAIFSESEPFHCVRCRARRPTLARASLQPCGHPVCVDRGCAQQIAVHRLPCPQCRIATAGFLRGAPGDPPPPPGAAPTGLPAPAAPSTARAAFGAAAASSAVPSAPGPAPAASGALPASSAPSRAPPTAPSPGTPGAVPAAPRAPGAVPAAPRAPGAVPAAPRAPGAVTVASGTPGAAPAASGTPGAVPVSSGTPGAVLVTSGTPGAAPAASGTPGAVRCTCGVWYPRRCTCGVRYPRSCTCGVWLRTPGVLCSVHPGPAAYCPRRSITAATQCTRLVPAAPSQRAAASAPPPEPRPPAASTSKSKPSKRQRAAAHESGQPKEVVRGPAGRSQRSEQRGPGADEARQPGVSAAVQAGLPEGAMPQFFPPSGTLIPGNVLPSAWNAAAGAWPATPWLPMTWPPHGHWPPAL